MIKEIYAGLVMVEKKCVEVLQQQATSTHRLTDEQWQALIALHRTLLHEHHDFFLASQHPMASPSLRWLAVKYAMPSRMWRHGIHAFLELLRHRLPDTLEHMMSHLSFACTMLDLLQQSVPSLTPEWVVMAEALQEYIRLLDDIGRNGPQNWMHHAPWWPHLQAEEDYDDRSPSSSRSSRGMDMHSSAGTSRWTQSDTTVEEEEFSDWYFRRHPPPAQSFTGHLELPEHVACGLSGWLYFGQGIAWRSFNIYSKVFTLLSLTARYSHCGFGSIFHPWH